MNKKDIKTAAIPAIIAIKPPSIAPMTFCFAAIATTIGMYIMLQKVMPFSVISPILKKVLKELERYISRNMAIPIPPTLASMPNKEPSNFPTNNPTNVQMPSNAIP